VILDNGVYAWGSSPSKSFQDAVANVKQYLVLHYPGRKLKNKLCGPWPSGYTSEMDETPELHAEQANYDQSQVGVMDWIVWINWKSGCSLKFPPPLHPMCQ